MSCPNRFIPEWAWEFLDQHRHLEQHPHTEVPFWEQRPRLKAFRKQFLAYLQEFREAMATGTNGPIPGVN